MLNPPRQSSLAAKLWDLSTFHNKRFWEYLPFPNLNLHHLYYLLFSKHVTIKLVCAGARTHNLKHEGLSQQSGSQCSPSWALGVSSPLFSIIVLSPITPPPNLPRLSRSLGTIETSPPLGFSSTDRHAKHKVKQPLLPILWPVCLCEADLRTWHVHPSGLSLRYSTVLATAKTTALAYLI